MTRQRRPARLLPELKAIIDGLDGHEAIARAIATFTIQRRRPRPEKLRMLEWDELTRKAHRSQKCAALEVFKWCRAAHVPDAITYEQARYAAAKVGEPYYTTRKSPHANDPSVRGFYQPPEWREEQRLEGIAEARAARERLNEPAARPQVRRRPGGHKPLN